MRCGISDGARSAQIGRPALLDMYHRLIQPDREKGQQLLVLANSLVDARTILRAPGQSIGASHLPS